MKKIVGIALALTVAVAIGFYALSGGLYQTEAAPDYGTKDSGDTFTATEHNELYNSVRELYGLVGNADYIKNTPVDASDIADGRVLKYNATSGYLEYEEDASGGASSAGGDLVATAPVTINGSTGVNDILYGDDADYTIAVGDAVANGSTKGVSTFNAEHFNSASGVISIDTANFTSGDMTFDADSVPASSVYTDSTSLEETSSPIDSGAYIVGVYDEFANSSGTNVQEVLNDLDAAISAGGSTNAVSIQGVDVDDTDIADDAVLNYDSTSETLVYTNDINMSSVTATNYYSTAVDGNRAAILPDNSIAPTFATGESGFYSLDDVLYFVEDGGTPVAFADVTDADTLDTLDSTQFLRSDADDSTTGSLNLSSDSSYLRLGAGQDFGLTHDGTNSYITNATGNLLVNNTSGSAVVFNENGANVDFRIEGDSINNLFSLDASYDSIGIATSPSAYNTLTVGQTYTNVTSNSTRYEKVVGIEGWNIPVAAGATDSGYRVGIAIDCYANGAEFAGTLNEQFGIWTRVGSNTSNPTGTITNSYGIFIDNLDGGATVTNKYGVFQKNTTAKNYFGGSIGIGTNSPSSKLHVDSDSGTTPQVYIEAANGNDVGVQFLQTGTEAFSIGIDDSDGAAFKISDSSVLGTNDRFKIDTSGDTEITGGLTVGKETVYTPTTITTSQTNLDVSGTSMVFCNPTSASITISGLTGGVAGQRVTFVKAAAANSLIFEYLEGDGDQDILTVDTNDITLTSRGGIDMVCDGSDWFVLGQ